MSKYITIYRTEEGQQYVGEVQEVENFNELEEAEKDVFNQIPTITVIDICEIKSSLNR